MVHGISGDGYNKQPNRSEKIYNAPALPEIEVTFNRKTGETKVSTNPIDDNNGFYPDLALNSTDAVQQARFERNAQVRALIDPKMLCLNELAGINSIEDYTPDETLSEHDKTWDHGLLGGTVTHKATSPALETGAQFDNPFESLNSFMQFHVA